MRTAVLLLLLLPSAAAVAAGYSLAVPTAGPTAGPTGGERSQPQQADEFDQGHTRFTALLKKHVSAQGVDYKRLVEDKDELVAYIATLEAISPEGLAAWTREQRLAFWVNVYNAHLLRLILDRFPLRSVMVLGNFSNSAWDKQFIRMGDHEPAERKPGDAGELLTLNQIQHGILDARFKDARIHAVICWATESSPRRMPEALVASTLEAQLDAQAQAWLADPILNQFDEEKGSIRISKLFDWFEKDFIRDAGSARAWIARYAPADVRTWLQSDAQVSVRYLPFKWKLSDKVE